MKVHLGTIHAQQALLFLCMSCPWGLRITPISVGLGQEGFARDSLQFGCKPLMWLIREEALDKVQGKAPLGWHWELASRALLFTLGLAPEAGKLCFTQELRIVRFLRMCGNTLCSLP